MRINKLIIENFRCYHGKHTFLLDNEITILFGDNGFGKSSFFDAIEWCLTGSINRFISNDKKILYNFLAKKDQICSVIIEFNNGTSLIRSFKIQENMRETVKLLDEEQKVISTGPKCVEYFFELSGHFQSNKKDLLSTSSLIKQSLILSQDQITDFVLRDEPKERFNALADIMGYKQLTTTINNLNQIKDKIKSNIRNNQPQIETYEKLISEKENEKQEVDIFTVNELLRKLNLEYSETLTDIFRDKKLNLNVEISNLIHNTEVLSSLSHLNVYSYNNYSKEVEVSKKTLFKTVFSKDKANILLGKINSKRSDLIGRIKNMNKERELFEEKEKIGEEILNIKKQIGANLYSETTENKDLNKRIKFLEIELKKIAFALNVNTQYRKYIKDIKKLPLQIVEQEIAIKNLEKELRVVNKKINKFNAIINKKEESGGFNSFNNAIQEIYKFVKDNSINNYCPVCSADNYGQLQENIYGNIQRNLNSIAQESFFLDKLLSRRTELNKQSRNLNKLVNNSKSNLKQIKDSLTFAENNLNEIKTNNLFLEVLFEEEQEFLTHKRIETDKEINKLNSTKLLLFELENLNRRKAQFDKLKLPQNIDENHSYRIMSRLEKQETKIKIIIEKLEEQCSKLDNGYENKKRHLLLWIENITEDERNIPLYEIYTQRKQTISSLSKEKEIINQVEHYMKIIEDNQRASVLIDKYRTEMNLIKSELNQLVNKHKDIENFIEKIYSKIGHEALEYFNKSDSSIQKYFRYLNPMPSSNKVLFKSDKEDELELIMSVEGTDGKYTDLSNVQYSMSSGQLNVLAISLFLAINESQTLSKLELIGIDDPIQNMDDVNQFSICDIFSTLNKQLILSTHDYDFLKLLVKKNEHRIKRLKVFMLESDRFANTGVKEITF